MAHDTIGSFLFLEENEDVELSALIKSLETEGWKIVRYDDGFEYEIGYDNRATADTDILYTEIDDASSATLRMEKDEVKVRVGKNRDRMETCFSGPEFERSIGTNPGIEITTVEYGLTRTNATSKDLAQHRVGLYTSVVEKAAVLTDPIYGFGTYAVESLDILTDRLPTIDELKRGGVQDIFWLNILSPVILRALDQERVMTGPAWQIKELSNGRIMVLTMDNPVEPGEDWIDGPNRLARHLGID